jgi:hypothetical protein
MQGSQKAWPQRSTSGWLWSPAAVAACLSGSSGFKSTVASAARASAAVDGPRSSASVANRASSGSLDAAIGAAVGVASGAAGGGGGGGGAKSSRQIGHEAAKYLRPWKASCCSRLSFSSSALHRLHTPRRSRGKQKREPAPGEARAATRV